MGSIKEYFTSLGTGIVSLIKGLQVTGTELVTPKITEFYPEDRTTRKWPERFRAILQLKYDEQGRHRCIACGTCERVCPNGTIALETKMVETPDGKKKKKLVNYFYDLGSCTFCNLCVINCPTDALEFSNDFEQAVLTRDKLSKKLNDRPDRQEDANYPDAPATPAAAPKAPAASTLGTAGAPSAAPAADPAAAKKIEVLQKTLAAKQDALAAATSDDEKAKIQAQIDKIQESLKALGVGAAPAAPAVDPATAKKIEVLQKTLAAKQDALAAAASDEDKAKIKAQIAKIQDSLKALGA